VRYPELAQSSLRAAVESPLRILGMVANPRDLEQLDAAGEKRRVEDAIQPGDAHDDSKEEGCYYDAGKKGRKYVSHAEKLRRGS
jgi:hypothetical protein